MRARSHLALALLLSATACGKKDDAEPEKKPPAPAPADAAPAPVADKTAADHYLDYVAAFNERDENRLKAAYAADAVLTLADVDGSVTGADAIVESNVEFWKAMPDTRIEPQIVIARDDMVAALVLGHGTHTGPLMTPAGELAPTEAETGSFGIEIVRLDDKGAIAEARQYMDVGLMLAHIQKDPGARPAMREGAKAPQVAIGEGQMHPMQVRMTEFIEVIEKADPTAIADAFAVDAVLWDSSQHDDAVGVAAIAAYYKARHKAFSVLAAQATSIWGAGDFVVAEVTYTGTNTGAWPPRIKKKTGKEVTLHAAEMFQVDAEAGKILRAWIVVNSLSLMQQLGLGPAK